MKKLRPVLDHVEAMNYPSFGSDHRSSLTVVALRKTRTVAGFPLGEEVGRDQIWTIRYAVEIDAEQRDPAD
jgi:hypothetical protein